MFGIEMFFKNESKLMKTDIRETDDNYIIDVDLPGFKKEDIKIDITDGYLNISAKMNSKHEDKIEKLRKRQYC